MRFILATLCTLFLTSSAPTSSVSALHVLHVRNHIQQGQQQQQQQHMVTRTHGYSSNQLTQEQEQEHAQEIQHSAPPIPALLGMTTTMAIAATSDMAYTARTLASPGAGGVGNINMAECRGPCSVPLGAFSYTKDSLGRVIRAQGFVTSTTDGTAIPNRVHTWLDAAYYHSGAGGLTDVATRVRDGTVWTAGHIVARSLGGSNTEPLNFFPHHVNSNGALGVYWRIENVIRVMQSVWDSVPLSGTATRCRGEISIVFQYPADCTLPLGVGVRSAVLPQFTPNGGTYEFRTSKACGDDYRTWLATQIATGVFTGPRAGDLPFAQTGARWVEATRSQRDATGEYYSMEQPWVNNGLGTSSALTHPWLY